MEFLKTGRTGLPGWGLVCVLWSGTNLLWAEPVVTEQETASFLQQHWLRPLAHQGAVPENYSELEASLEPEASNSE